MVDFRHRAPRRFDARLHGLARETAPRDETIYWPGHGGPVLDPQRYLRALIHHLRQREASILTALGDGAQTIPALVAKVYAGLSPSLTGAAGLSTLAHLEDLSERGLVVAEAADGGAARFRLA